MSHRERGCLERTHEEPEGIARKKKKKEKRRGERERGNRRREMKKGRKEKIEE